MPLGADDLMNVGMIRKQTTRKIPGNRKTKQGASWISQATDQKEGGA